MSPSTFRPTLFVRMVAIVAALLGMFALSLQAPPAHAEDGEDDKATETTAVQTTVLEVVSGETLIVDAQNGALPDPNNDGRAVIHLSGVSTKQGILGLFFAPSCEIEESADHLTQLLGSQSQVIIDTEHMVTSPWPVHNINHATVLTLGLDDLGYQQIADGYAQASPGKHAPERIDDYLDVQDRAMQSDAGLWSGCQAS